MGGGEEERSRLHHWAGLDAILVLSEHLAVYRVHKKNMHRELFTKYCGSAVRTGAVWLGMVESPDWEPQTG